LSGLILGIVMHETRGISSPSEQLSAFSRSFLLRGARFMTEHGDILTVTTHLHPLPR